MSKILNDSVLLRLKDSDIKEQLSPAGLTLVSYNEIKTQYIAEVIDVGPGRLLNDGSRVKPTVQIGDEVLIGANSGFEIKINDEKLRIVHESDIFVIF